MTRSPDEGAPDITRNHKGGWFLDRNSCSDMAAESLIRFLHMAPNAHTIDIHMRADGVEHEFQADILKYMNYVDETGVTGGSRLLKLYEKRLFLSTQLIDESIGVLESVTRAKLNYEHACLNNDIIGQDKYQTELSDLLSVYGKAYAIISKVRGDGV